MNYFSNLNPFNVLGKRSAEDADFEYSEVEPKRLETGKEIKKPPPSKTPHLLTELGRNHWLSAFFNKMVPKTLDNQKLDDIFKERLTKDLHRHASSWSEYYRQQQAKKEKAILPPSDLLQAAKEMVGADPYERTWRTYLPNVDDPQFKYIKNPEIGPEDIWDPEHVPDDIETMKQYAINKKQLYPNEPILHQPPNVIPPPQQNYVQPKIDPQEVEKDFYSDFPVAQQQPLPEVKQQDDDYDPLAEYGDLNDLPVQQNLEPLNKPELQQKFSQLPPLQIIINNAPPQIQKVAKPPPQVAPDVQVPLPPQVSASKKLRDEIAEKLADPEFNLPDDQIKIPEEKKMEVDEKSKEGVTLTEKQKIEMQRKILAQREQKLFSYGQKWRQGKQGSYPGINIKVYSNLRNVDPPLPEKEFQKKIKITDLADLEYKKLIDFLEYNKSGKWSQLIEQLEDNPITLELPKILAIPQDAGKAEVERAYEDYIKNSIAKGVKQLNKVKETNSLKSKYEEYFDKKWDQNLDESKLPEYIDTAEKNLNTSYVQENLKKFNTIVDKHNLGSQHKDLIKKNLKNNLHDQNEIGKYFRETVEPHLAKLLKNEMSSVFNRDIQKAINNNPGIKHDIREQFGDIQKLFPSDNNPLTLDQVEQNLDKLKQIGKTNFANIANDKRLLVKQINQQRDLYKDASGHEYELQHGKFPDADGRDYSTNNLRDILKTLQQETETEEKTKHSILQTNDLWKPKYDQLRKEIKKYDQKDLPQSILNNEVYKRLDKYSGDQVESELQYAAQNHKQALNNVEHFTEQVDEYEKLFENFKDNHTKKTKQSLINEYRNAENNLRQYDPNAPTKDIKNLSDEEIQAEIFKLRKDKSAIQEKMKKVQIELNQVTNDGKLKNLNMSDFENTKGMNIQQMEKQLHDAKEFVRITEKKEDLDSKKSLQQRVSRLDSIITNLSGSNEFAILNSELNNMDEKQLETEKDKKEKHLQQLQQHKHQLQMEISKKVGETQALQQRLVNPQMDQEFVRYNDIHNPKASINDLITLKSQAEKDYLKAHNEVIREERIEKETFDKSLKQQMLDYKLEDTKVKEQQHTLREQEKTKVLEIKRQEKELKERLDKELKEAQIDKDAETKKHLADEHEFTVRYLANETNQRIRDIQTQSRKLQRDLTQMQIDAKKEAQAVQQEFLGEQHNLDREQKANLQMAISKTQKDIMRINNEEREKQIALHQKYFEQNQINQREYMKIHEDQMSGIRKDEMGELSRLRKEEKQMQLDYNKELLNLKQQREKRLEEARIIADKERIRLQHQLSEESKQSERDWRTHRFDFEERKESEKENKIVSAQQAEIDEVIKNLEAEHVPIKLARKVQDSLTGQNLVQQYRRLEGELREVGSKRTKLKHMIKRVHHDLAEEAIDKGVLVPNLTDVDNMDLKSLNQNITDLQNLELDATSTIKQKEKREVWSHELNQIQNRIKNITGQSYDPVDVKTAPENSFEFQKQKNILENVKETAEEQLKNLNQRKHDLYEEVVEQRKNMSPEARRLLPNLIKFHTKESVKNKLLAGDVKGVKEEVNELSYILENEKSLLQFDESGRQAASTLDTYVDALRSITGDTATYYKVLSNAASGKETPGAKVNVDDMMEFQKNASQAFELANKVKFLNRGQPNPILINHIINSAKHMFEKSGLDKNLHTDWEQVANRLNNENEVRGKATVETLAKNPALAEMYLISLGQDLTTGLKVLDDENPIKLFTAMKSMGIDARLPDAKSMSVKRQVETLLQQIPPQLFEKAQIEKIVSEQELNERNWQRQIGRIDSFSENYIRDHMVTGDNKQQVVSSLLKSGYHPGDSISRLDMSTGNFYPTSLKQVKGNEAYFINKPKDIRNLYGLKKDSILHHSNKLMGPFGLEYGRDKQRRAMDPRLGYTPRYANLAQFLNALPSTKHFLNNKEKFLQDLTGKKDLKPKRKEVKKKMLKRKKKRKAKKKAKGKHVSKGGELSETDDDALYNSD